MPDAVYLYRRFCAGKKKPGNLMRLGGRAQIHREDWFQLAVSQCEMRRNLQTDESSHFCEMASTVYFAISSHIAKGSFRSAK
jgi:hypothetical protein